MKQRILSTLTLLLCFAFTSVKAQDNYNATTMGEKVHLETASWGQNEPFNNQIFTAYEGSTHAKAGCVPTAYAIVMRYHGFPAEGTANKLYNCQASTYVEITDRTYDWGKMPLVYDTDWTQEQKDEVSKLFSHVLHAVFPSSIGVNATTANEEQTSAKLNRYFDYQLINASYQADFTMDQWAEKLRESIANGCPVPYASNNSGTGDTRHMFVVDGYTEEGYFHFNFGWAGSGNGWFKLDDITPSQGDNYSWKENSQHYALFNLAPNNLTKRTVTATVNPSNTGSVSINGCEARESVSVEANENYNVTLTATPAAGYAFVSWTKDGEIVGTRSTLQVPVGTSDNDYVANFDEASNVYVTKDYVVNPTNGSLSGGTSKYSTWTSTDTQPALTLKATNASGAAVYAMSALSSSYKFYATAYDSSDKAHTNITYTLSVPEGYVITNYLMTYNVGTAGQISLNGELLNATGDHTLSAAPNAQTASFTLSVSSAGQQYLTVKSIEVTIQSQGAGEGEGSGSTQEPDSESISAKIIGVNKVPTTKLDLSQGLKTGYYLLKQVNDHENAAGGHGVGWIKASSEAAGQPESVGATEEYKSSRKAVSTSTANPDALCVWYVEVVNAENKEIKISTANKIGSWYLPKGSQRQKGLTSYENATVLKYHIGTATMGTQTATAKDGAYFISNSDVSSFIHFSGTELGSWSDANQGSMFMVEFYKLNNDDLVVEQEPEEVIPSNEKTLDVTFNNAAYTKTDGTELTSGWGYQVVTQTTPAVTIKVAETKNNFGYTTGVISGVKTPYLYKNTNFILSVSEQYKITGYKITVRGQDNSYSGDFTCSVDGNETSKATLSGTTTQTLSATDLNTNTINIAVGGTSGNGIFITALEITYVENEFEPLPFKAEVEGWRDNNPNTHLGTITIGGKAMKLTPEHLTASELTMPVAAGTTLAINHKYRGFEFNGFYIGATSLGESVTLTADNVAAIDENNPLIAKFTATNTGEATLFSAEDEFSYRIPAIVKTVKDDKHKLIAISDYRHSFDDIGRDNHKTGTTQVDLVIRTSEDNGATWTAKQTIAEGSQHFGYGDAAAVANGQDVLVMAVAGNVFYAYANSDNPQQAYRIYSNDNGVTWEKEDISSNMESLFPDYHGLFFGSGKLAVDPDFNGSGNARVYGAILMKDSQGERNYVLYSDNWGKTWNILGNAVAARQNEPKVEILPNGQILLSARRDGGRTFNVFTYSNKATSEGSWDNAENGCANGGNSTNGEIICLDAKKPNGTLTKILLQSQPYGSDRRNVSIWYKELSGDNFTALGIASDWTMGKQVSDQLSAYSAMCLQANGEIALFFEEAPCYSDDHTKGYSMVYVPLTIEEITNNNFLNPSAEVELVEFNIELTDGQGNIYRETLDYIPTDVAATLTAKYPFITLGENGVVADNKYTNTVTLPFKVSNANTTVWHNIYWPANDTSPGKYYPIYLLSTGENDTYVAKKTETKHYGESSYNTLNWADELSWAVYSVDGTLNFKFKNKLTGKFMAVNGVVSSGSTNNVIYTDEANATTFTLEKYTGTNTYYGNYAIKSVYNGTTGYVCNTSASHANATNYTRTDHAGAWVKFVEAPDYQAIVDALTANVAKFGTGNGNYTDNDDINAIKAIENIATTPLNTLNTHTNTVQTVKDSYTEITLTVPAVNDVVPGSVKILDEPVSHKFVPKGSVTIEAVPAAGYRFVNWTRPAAAQASTAARTAAARNSNVVSDQNPYTVTVSEALSLEANFEEIVVTATLKDERENIYNVTLNAFAGEINQANVEAKLLEKYPYIEFGNEAAFNATANTYSNRIVLPFKVSNPADEKSDNMWHNIYYPTNASAKPNYLAGAAEDAEFVSKVNDDTYEFGANPTYNTMDGNPSISWAIYNVNNSFEFIFKNELTGKYIRVKSVATADKTQNVQFVDKAEATVFTLLKKTGNYNGDYALVAKVGETTGYLCSTSSTYDWATCFGRNNHQGAWLKFAEANYEELIYSISIPLYGFGTGNDKYMQTAEIQAINNAFGTYESPLYQNITLNILKTYFETVNYAINNWPMVSLTIAPENCGTTTIGGEENVNRKYVPNGDLALNAVPAEGYHFVSWTDGTSEVETAEYTKTISGKKGDVIELTATFAKNIYTVVASATEGGTANASAATVEYGSEVTLTATPSAGYEFLGWYNGETKVSDANPYTFTVTSDINYTARFNETAVTPPATKYAINVTVASTDGTEVVNNATGNVQAVIADIGVDWCTGYEFEYGYSAHLIATEDCNKSACLFEGWYIKDTETCIGKETSCYVTITENMAVEARFSQGSVITVTSDSKSWGYPNIITYENGDPVVGTATELRAVARDGEKLLLSIEPNYGYRVANWTDKDGNEVAGKNANSFVLTVNGDNKYTAHIERATYTLTVRANNDEYGTVNAVSLAGNGAEIPVGHNMEATITATAKPGYHFVSWTKGTEVVSEDVEYTIAGIADVENMVDVEYIANFEKNEVAEAGIYYRFAYEFDVPVETPANSAATRAVGDIKTYSIITANGTATVDPNDYNRTSLWSFTTNEEFPAGLTLKATYTYEQKNGDETQTITETIKAIQVGNSFIDLRTGGYTDSGATSYNNVTFTLSVQNSNYKIVGYEIESYKNISQIKFAPTGESLIKDKVYGESFEPAAEHSFSFESDMIRTVELNHFYVYIQEVGGGETPEPEPEPETEKKKFYIQSTPVSGTNNAMVMTTDTTAASVFYYTDSKLMSYANGKFVKEEGTACGLQAYGAENAGVVTITENGDGTATIAAPSYLHANSANGVYFVDHSGATATCQEHNFIIEEVKALPVTITAAKYATFYAPVAVKIPEGVQAWYLESARIFDDYVSMTEITDRVIPAYTAVVVGSETPATYLFEIVDEPVSPITGNKLSGTVAAEYIPVSSTQQAYILSIVDGKVGLYKAKKNGPDEESFLSLSHRAYLLLDTTPQSSNGFRLVFGTTAIEEVEAENNAEGIYDLSGRKLEGINGPGIYIVNGKKVLVK